MWFIKLLKFGVVGGLGIGMDFSVTWICKEKLKINKYISNALGFSCAVVQNYLLHRIWTFESKNPAVFLQFSKFLMISLIGLAINFAFVYLFHERFQVPFYGSKILAILLVFFWNFSANYYFTF